MNKTQFLQQLMDFSIVSSGSIPDDVKRTAVLKMISEEELDKLLYSESTWLPSNHLNYLYARQTFTTVCLMWGLSPKKIRKTIKYWDNL